MIVFDVDGTLIDGEKTDWACYDAAFKECAGFGLTEEFFAGIRDVEVTAQAIVHMALGDRPTVEKKAVESRVRIACLRNLEAAVKNDPLAFRAVPGAIELLGELHAKGIAVAIATGDWKETISFKLKSAGIDISRLPVVTSSEYYSRADIIAAAVAKCGRALSEALYVGDGQWDLRACQKLGIPFIGVGPRRETLRAAGAKHLLTDLDPLSFWPVHSAARE